MVYKCCAPGCRGNYDKNSPKVHTFKFPDDKDLQKNWVNFLKRDKSFTITKHTRLCELHFKPEDIHKHEKIFDRNKGVYITNTLERPYLKKGAVPVFLHNCPKHRSKKVSNRKSLKEKQDEIQSHTSIIRAETQNQFKKEKDFSNLDDFREGLKKNGEWNNWTINYYENEIVFVVFTRIPIMKVVCSVIMDSDCNARIFNDVMELENFRTKLDNFDDFEELLSRVRSACDVNKCSDNTVESRVKDYIFLIESALLKIDELVDDDEKKKAINYLIEQMLASAFCKKIKKEKIEYPNEMINETDN